MGPGVGAHWAWAGGQGWAGGGQTRPGQRLGLRALLNLHSAPCPALSHLHPLCPENPGTLPRVHLAPSWGVTCVYVFMCTPVCLCAFCGHLCVYPVYMHMGVYHCVWRAACPYLSSVCPCAGLEGRRAAALDHQQRGLQAIRCHPDPGTVWYGAVLTGVRAGTQPPGFRAPRTTATATAGDRRSFAGSQVGHLGSPLL